MHFIFDKNEHTFFYILEAASFPIKKQNIQETPVIIWFLVTLDEIKWIISEKKLSTYKKLHGHENQNAPSERISAHHLCKQKVL